MVRRCEHDRVGFPVSGVCPGMIYKDMIEEALEEKEIL
jgi:hypothetical protein